jgi:hypothetical protein
MWLFWWFWEPIGVFARWVGERLGVGLAGIAGETGYLAQRTRTASPSERSAWLFRCIVSCIILAGEGLVLTLFGVRTDHPLTLVIAWTAIFLLSKPTPRVPLLIARMLAVIFTMTNLAALYDLAKAKLLALQAYGAIFGFCGFVIWIALSLWALSALRSTRTRARMVSNRLLIR